MKNQGKRRREVRRAAFVMDGAAPLAYKGVNESVAEAAKQRWRVPNHLNVSLPVACDSKL